MINPKLINQDIIKIKTSIENRQANLNLERIQQLSKEYHLLLPIVENLRFQRNKISNEIGKNKENKVFFSKSTAKMATINKELKKTEKKCSDIKKNFETLMLLLPNIPHSSVPIGKNAKDNVTISHWGSIPTFDFKPLPHWEIGESLDIIDSKRSARMVGSRFITFKGLGALLERALINLMLDIHTQKHGYTEIAPPSFINSKALTGTGHLPKFSEDSFKIEKTDYWLIPTAEVPLTSLHMQETIDEKKLPILYTAYTPCFRAEAGSHGKDVKGLTRLHQFNKVELFHIANPEKSYIHLENITKHAEKILQFLEIPYRKILLCTGDLGFSSAKTYDLEVWMPGQNCYREISSCSNMEDFQARRLNIKYKKNNTKKTELVHTLNGSGLAIDRTIAAILENNQKKDKSILLPQILTKYMGDIDLIK